MKPDLLFRLCAVVLLSLLWTGCGKDYTDLGREPEPPAGKVALQLRFGVPDVPVSWGKEAVALVNGVNCSVGFDRKGNPVVYADIAADGSYTVVYPAEAYSRVRQAFVLPPAQFPAADGGFDPRFCPMYGRAAAPGEVVLTPLCGVLQLTVVGSAQISSIRLEDKAGQMLTGLFPFDAATLRLTQNTDPQNMEWCVLNCADEGEGTPLASTGTMFWIALPVGDYSAGMSVRISDRSHRAATFEIPGPCAIRAGEVKTVSPIHYAPDEKLLFAEYFDNCVWGSDYAAEKGGYGVTAGAAVPNAATMSGTEVAYVSKSAGTAGSVLFETTDYTSLPAASQSLVVRRDYLRNRNLYDWTKLFYASEYRGALGGGDLGRNTNRGIIATPMMSNIDAPCYAELRFRICLERGMAAEIDCLAGSGVLFGAEINGVPIDVDAATSTNISQWTNGFNTSLMLDPAVVELGRWHEVRLSFGAVSGGTYFRLQPTVIRNAKNCFWIDDVEVHRTADYPFKGDFIPVEPTTELAASGADVSRLRLQPSSTLSMGSEISYVAAPGLGMKWISPALPSDESVWGQTITAAEKYLADNGCKVWCIHLPYGPRGDVRNRDLCAPDDDRAIAVAYFTKVIRAVAPLKPKNVLVHCNQTLAFDDGSSPESLALSLHELQTVADQIGAHICVENMSYGVGADAGVLADAVDKANAMGSHRFEVRIGFDTGHANLYVTRTQPGKTVVDWLRTAGARIGQLHIHGNRGWKGSITDDHLMPNYKGQLVYSDAIGAAGLWGEFYHVLLSECRYRGPFTYEIGSRSFGEVDGQSRYDNIASPWHVLHNYNSYLYPALRAYSN